MREFNQPLRKAIYELLNGQLTFDSAIVPVFDGKVKQGESSNSYVLIGNTSSVDNSTFSGWSRRMSTVVDIVTKMTDTSSTDIADSIAAQILELMMPTIGGNGLVQANFQYVNVSLNTDRYLELQQNPTTIMLRRLLTFLTIVNQTS